MIRDSLLEVVVLVVLLLGAVGAVLAALFVIVRAAVEQGLRRALPDSALRPDVREVLRSDGVDTYRAASRREPPAT